MGNVIRNRIDRSGICPIKRYRFFITISMAKGDSMKDNRHKEPRQKPWGQAERIQTTGSRLPKTIAREAWVKSKENLIPAKRTNPDSNYAYAQEMEEDSVQQVENCLEDATLLTLQRQVPLTKTGSPAKGNCINPIRKVPCIGILWNREKETVVREPSKTNPQGTSKQEQQRCTAQKQIEQQVKKVAREIRGVDIDQKQLRTAANTARKGKGRSEVTQRTQRMIYRAKQAAGESAEATKKGIAVIRSAIRHWMTAMQSLAAALIAGGWVSVFTSSC